MANLYWIGSTGASGGDWNTSENWYVPVLSGTAGQQTYKLSPAGRTPFGSDNVYIKNSNIFQIVGNTGPICQPILANCSTGGMQLSGATYNWVNNGITLSGTTGTGPLNFLDVSVDAPYASGYTYATFAFNENNTISLFWKQATSEVHQNLETLTWMPTDITFTMNFHGVANSFNASLHNNIISYHSIISQVQSQSSSNRKQDTILKGKIGKWKNNALFLPGSTASTAFGDGFWFGSLAVASNSTVTTMEIRGQPTVVEIPLGTTCSTLIIEPINQHAGITTDIYVGCSIGRTTSKTLSGVSSANDYTANVFNGIKFAKTAPYTIDSPNYSIFIGNPTGNTGSIASPLFYNIWENDVSNIIGGQADIQIQGSCFINDILLEDSSLKISSLMDLEDTVEIKKGEIRGFSSIDLRKEMPDGQTLSVPQVYGNQSAPPYIVAGITGAAGLLISSPDATFIPHHNTTVSF